MHFRHFLNFSQKHFNLIDRYFNIVSISKEHGIGILDEPVTFSSMRPIHFYCEGPGEVHRGESVGIRCMVMNRSPYDLEAVIVLKGNTFLYSCKIWYP